MANEFDRHFLDQRGLEKLWSLIKAKIANLADNQSTIYLTDDEHLSIKGYNEANHGQMLVKDREAGLSWIDPLNETQLRQAVQQAEAARDQAGNYSTQAGSSATSAATSAATAERINEQTMTWVNNKFWWGTITEYNQLEEINEGTFYFVQL